MSRTYRLENQISANYKGYLSSATASRRFNAIQEFLDENRITHMVVQLPGGRYVPVCMLTDHNEWCVSFLIGVTGIVTSRA
jgi:hypothetical protein